MNDFKKQSLSVGDRVITYDSNYAGLLQGEIVAFTPKMIKIKLLTQLGNAGYCNEVGTTVLRTQSQVVLDVANRIVELEETVKELMDNNGDTTY